MCERRRLVRAGPDNRLPTRLCPARRHRGQTAPATDRPSNPPPSHSSARTAVCRASRLSSVHLVGQRRLSSPFLAARADVGREKQGADHVPRRAAGRGGAMRRRRRRISRTDSNSGSERTGPPHSSPPARPPLIALGQPLLRARYYLRLRPLVARVRVSVAGWIRESKRLPCASIRRGSVGVSTARLDACCSPLPQI